MTIRYKVFHVIDLIIQNECCEIIVNDTQNQMKPKWTFLTIGSSWYIQTFGPNRLPYIWPKVKKLKKIIFLQIFKIQFEKFEFSK